MAANYSSVNNSQQQLNSPYGSGDPYLNQSTGYIAPMNAEKKKSNNWLKIGLPILILVIIGAVVGGVVGSRKSSSSSASSKGGAGSTGSNVAPGEAVSAKLEVGRFATATNGFYGVPIYPATTNAAAFSQPTFASSSNSKLAWPQDPFKPSSPDVNTVRDDRPRLIAPAHKWAALPELIKNEPYLKGWNDTIFGNATAYAKLPPVKYFMDGPSGILDNAREIKMRIKAYGYVQRMTGDKQWADKAYAEIENAVSTNFGPNNDTKWNPSHFLDTAELTAAFAIAYDWMYDVWTADQKTFIMSNMIQYGLKNGVDAYTNPQSYNGWWRTKTTGNWNCVCNSGLTLGSLAILNDDTSGIAKQLLGLTIQSAKENCAQAPMTDGTWAESPNYWYFGSTGHAEMSSSLLTATGSHYGLLDTNPNYQKTGLFHMAVYGAVSLFDYGDHGPNKFSATANSMIFYGSQYDEARYTLFQRDRPDAAEPWSMFWYDPTVSGAYWDNMDLDMLFDGDSNKWAALRSSWTDPNALYVAMKAGKNQGQQTHNDLDVGDFVLDCLGTRWAGELGSGDYNSPEYFSSDSQDAVRWTYYRKMTEGQNTITIKEGNQNVLADPVVKMETSGTKQGSSTVSDIPSDSNAYFKADMTSAYFDATSVKRGVRMINKRRQVLIQDEINSTGDIQWRMHTNATIAIDGSSVTLSRDGKTMKLSVLNPPQGMQISQAEPKRTSGTSVKAPPVADQENPGVNVLVISVPAGQVNLQVLFNPQWDGMKDGDFVTPPSVPLDNWSLTSHN